MRSAMPVKRQKRAKKTARVEPLLSRNDFASYLETKAREMAPRDVQVIVRGAAAARARAAADHHPRLGAQIDLAMRILTDHATGNCPQIPYYTISLLAEAVYYFLDPNDAIPDWIPDIGTADDALIVELAFELGAAGVERYCAWKGIHLASFMAGAELPVKAAGKKAAASGKRPGAAKKSPARAKSAAKLARKKR